MMKLLKNWLGMILVIIIFTAIMIVIISPENKDKLLDYVKGIGKQDGFVLGDEMLFKKGNNKLIDGKNIGLITNHTGVNSKGESTIQVLYNYKGTKLKALYAPEHGLNGQALGGEDIKSYVDEKLKIPVYSLYGDTRMPTEDMLKDVDVILFDIQDLGSRTYTYMSTLNYAMVAAKKFNKTLVVLDRPNPLGCKIFDGPMMEDKYQSFVGVDTLPMTHGMTAGELSQYFNRKINCKLQVVKMQGYRRDMLFQDTGLKWIPTSPKIPDIESAFDYCSTGIGEGTGFGMDDNFKWVGMKGIDSTKFAEELNKYKLEGVSFIAENRGQEGGVRIKILDYKKYNPAKTGIYILATARILGKFTVPKSTEQIVMFDKIMGNAYMGQELEQFNKPQDIEAKYQAALKDFGKEREKYLIYK